VAFLFSESTIGSKMAADIFSPAFAGIALEKKSIMQLVLY
jgi:hypothetical protein